MSQPVPVPGRAIAGSAATGRTLEEHYELLDVLGRGSFSVVQRVRHRHTGEHFACKLIDKWSIHNRQRLANEIEVLQRVSHPAVIRLHDIFETERVLALVTDIAAGGELFDKIVDKGRYSEKEASDVISQLLQAIQHLHAAGIVHRDIKPENILLASKDDDVGIKLSDFGLAKIFSGDDMGTTPDNAYGRARAFTVCGTDYYVAPEVLQHAGYTHACDLWSVGVVLYILLSGCPPFYEGGEEGISVQRKIIAGKYSFPEQYWAAVSAEAKDLVSNLLVVDPARRFSVRQCLAHPWVVRHGVSTGPLPQRNTDNFKSFNNKRKNSVAGSPLVGSYSVFGSLHGSLQSPAEHTMHVPGKHRRTGASIPHSLLNAPLGAHTCGSVPEGAPTNGDVGGELGARAVGPSGLSEDARGDANGVPLGSVGAGGVGDAAASAAGVPIPIPGRGGDRGGGGHGGLAGGLTGTTPMAVPGAAAGPGAFGNELSVSPPAGLLSASPNPGFMMEI